MRLSLRSSDAELSNGCAQLVRMLAQLADRSLEITDDSLGHGKANASQVVGELQKVFLSRGSHRRGRDGT